MKKLLIITLVLCMTSLAGATTISMTDEHTTITATPGSDVTLYISSDAATSGLGLISFDAVVTVTGGDVIVDALGNNPCFFYPCFGWEPPLTPPIGLGTPTVEIGGGATNFITGNLEPIIGFVVVAYTGGTQVVDIGPGMSWGGSYLINGSPPVFSTGTVEIIPEPATLALLGLGALAILRRRN